MPATATHIRALGVHEPAPPVSGAGAALQSGHGDAAVAQWVASAKSGDREAIRFLYARYEENIYGYILSMIRDRHEAEDLTRHVFLKLMSVVHEYEPRQAPFLSWLLRVTRDVALDHLRQQPYVSGEEALELLLHADDSEREDVWASEQGLEVDGEEQRNVTVLRHRVGLTPNESDGIMGCEPAESARAAAS